MAGPGRDFEMSTRCPSISSSPPEGASISAMMRASVDLPEPDSPTMASVLPFSTLKSMPLSARTVLDPPKKPPETW